MHMTLQKHYGRLFDHAGWANRRVLEALRGIADETEAVQPKKWFAHVLGAERVWLTRLQGKDSSGLAIWPAYNLPECEALVAANAEGYRQFLSGLSDGDFAREAVYRNSTGTEFRTSIGDIMAHVALHGSYHRGQIASHLRIEDFTPASTDYILFVREQ